MHMRLFLSGVGIVVGLLLALAGVGLMSSPAAAQRAFATNTPSRLPPRIIMPTDLAPSATAASLTLTARALTPSATPTPTYIPTDTPAPPVRVNGVVSRDQVFVCLFCVIVE